MRYEKELIIDKKEIEEINRLLHTEPGNAGECFGEDVKISHTIAFCDGIEMDIELCGVQYEEDSESNLPWTQAVLYKNGTELTFTEPSDEYEGKWICNYGSIDNPEEDDEFVVNVITR